MEPEFVDIPPDKRFKYPAIFEGIEANTTEDNKDKWVLVGTFASPAAGRDTASRLGQLYTRFEVTSRTDSEQTKGYVYARFVGEA